MPLFGTMNPEDQDRIFSKNSKRKVIVSTNIAETSLTIDGVRFVIDSGVIKQKDFNFSTGIESLTVKQHAKSGCDQRKGRAGRTAPGKCYRLFTETEWDKRPDFQTPEILRSNLDNVILTMKRMGIQDIVGFDFIDKPSPVAIRESVKTLQALGALDENEKITPIGQEMADLPLSPEIAKMVIKSREYGCSESITIIAALISDGGGSLFLRSDDEQEIVKRFSGETSSDFLTLLRVYRGWESSGFSRRFLSENNINPKKIYEAREVLQQLRKIVTKTEKRKSRHSKDENPVEDTVRGAELEKAITKSIISGLLHKLFISYGDFGYVPLNSNHRMEHHLHPGSIAFKSPNRPDVLVGHGIKATEKKRKYRGRLKTIRRIFIRSCQPAPEKLLIEIAPHLFRENNRTVEYNPDTDNYTETITYEFKDYPKKKFKIKQITSNPELTTEAFIEALVSGKVNLPAIAYNQEVLERLDRIRTNSGGLVGIPDMEDFYRSKLGGAQNRQEARYINDRLQLDFYQYCPQELEEEIVRKYPTEIQIGPHKLIVSYEYKPVSEGYYGKTKEIFRATIEIPSSMLFEFEESDIPQIGEDDRPNIFYRSIHNNVTYSSTNIEALRTEIDNQRIIGAWHKFQAPITPEITDIDADLVPLESLGINPIPYAKDYKGNEVFAYPGYKINEVYDYQLRAYVKSYIIKYYRTREEADQANRTTEEDQKKVREKAIARRNREILLEPTRIIYDSMRDTMRDLNIERANYNLTRDEYHEIVEKFVEADHILTSEDRDPNEAMVLMRNIRLRLEKGKEERERRLSLIPSTKAKLETMRQKIDDLTRDNCHQYGISYDQYYVILDKWREVEKLITPFDSDGDPLLIDPEQALEIAQRAIGIIPEKIQFTEEQRELAEILSNRDSAFAKLVKIQNGRVIEYDSAKNPGYPSQNPTEIPIGGSGRKLVVQRNRLTFVYGSGNPDGTFTLPDGNYVISRDAGRVIKVEEDKNLPNGLLAIEFMDRDFVDYSQASPSSNVVTQNEETGSLGTLEDIIRRKEIERRKRDALLVEDEVVRVQTGTPQQKVEMTEDERINLFNALIDIRIFLDNIRAIPEPSDPTLSNSKQISKIRKKAAEAKKDLNEIEKELVTSNNLARMNGKIAEINKRTERLVAKISRINNENENWPDRFKELRTRLLVIAQGQAIEIDDSLLKRMIPDIIRLSKNPNDISDEALEEILIENI